MTPHTLIFIVISISIIAVTFSYSITKSNRIISSAKTYNVPRPISTTNRRSKLFNNKVEVDASAKEEKKEYSFVNDDLRKYAMRLHTKTQAPREGKAPEKPQMSYEPTRGNYLSFLVDSLRVYETFEEIIRSNAVLEPFEDTGLDRSIALKEDIAWMVQNDPSLSVPECGAAGQEYSAFLKELIKESHVPKFMCHYYNHYFAHTAGGLMIGKRMSTSLLDGHTLNFYKWDGEVKELLGKTKTKVDALASTWTAEEKEDCMASTMDCFKYSGGLMVYFRAPMH